MQVDEITKSALDDDARRFRFDKINLVGEEQPSTQLVPPTDFDSLLFAQRPARSRFRIHPPLPKSRSSLLLLALVLHTLVRRCERRGDRRGLNPLMSGRSVPGIVIRDGARLLLRRFVRIREWTRFHGGRARCVKRHLVTLRNWRRRKCISQFQSLPSRRGTCLRVSCRSLYSATWS